MILFVHLPALLGSVDPRFYIFRAIDTWDIRSKIKDVLFTDHAFALLSIKKHQVSVNLEASLVNAYIALRSKRIVFENEYQFLATKLTLQQTFLSSVSLSDIADIIAMYALNHQTRSKRAEVKRALLWALQKRNDYLPINVVMNPQYENNNYKDSIALSADCFNSRAEIFFQYPTKRIVEMYIPVSRFYSQQVHTFLTNRYKDISVTEAIKSELLTFINVYAEKK